jgi:hypothetical protein
MQRFTGIQYLMIDIANSFGLDKETWDHRLQWFADNEPQLDALVSDAEEPAQFLAGVLAYRKAQLSQPTGYMCGLDATASGIQLLAILSGCRISADSVNLTGTPGRKDAYTRCYARINEILESAGSIARSRVKEALMTAMYGSKAVPKRVFGEGTPELAAFYQVIDELLPGVNALNQELIALWRDDVHAHYWQLPDGFEVAIKVIVEADHPIEFNGVKHVLRVKHNLPKKGGIALGANIIHSVDGMIVREMNRRCNFDVNQVNKLRQLTTGGTSLCRPKDQELLKILRLCRSAGFLSGVVIEHLDEKNFGHLDASEVRKLRMLLLSMQKSFPVVCIHDCFKFHANNGNEVREHYRNILAELASSTVLQHIASQILRKPLTLKVDDISDLIEDSSYALS